MATANDKLEQLLLTENAQLRKLNEIVISAIEEEKLLSQRLYELDENQPALGSKIADTVASFGGSWRFIIAFGIFLGVWMIANVFLLRKPFDPFPFILLNLFMSAIAALQAPIIMMSQNRKEEKDRRRASSKSCFRASSTRRRRRSACRIALGLDDIIF